jgi:hypothetical protein
VGTFHAGPNQKQDRPKRHENNQIPAAGVVDVVLPATGHCEAWDENRQEIGDEHGRDDYRRRSFWRRRRNNFDSKLKIIVNNWKYQYSERGARQRKFTKFLKKVAIAFGKFMKSSRLDHGWRGRQRAHPTTAGRARGNRWL